MNERVKNLWVKALKSGEFKQIKGKLHDGKGYCALGVLAALAMLEGQCTYGPGNTFDGRSSTLSFNTMKWAGIDVDEDGELKLTKGAGKVLVKQTSIAELNDIGLSFNEIAKIIARGL